MDLNHSSESAPGLGVDAGTGTPDHQATPTSAAPGEARRAATSPASRAGAFLEVLLCSGFPTQLFIGQILVIAGLRPFTADGHYSTTFIFTLSLADALLLVGLIVLLLWGRGESVRAVLFGPRPLLPEGVLGIFLIPFMFVLGVAVLLLARVFAPWLHNVVHNPLEALIESRRDAALFSLVVIVSGGVREEVQRAFILHRFEQKLGGAVVGLVVSSVMFGAGHMIQGWDAALVMVMFGTFWGSIYLIRRSIGAPLISHAGFDLAMIIRYTLYRL